MDNLYTIIGLLSSIITIIAWVLSMRKLNGKRNIIMVSIISVLSLLTTASLWLYKQETDKQLNIEYRKQAIKVEAKKILESAPSYISFYEPGENQGILYSTLVLLESNKDIYPETYELYKKDVIKKIEKSNEEKDSYTRKEQMEIAGKSAMQFLKSIAK